MKLFIFFIFMFLYVFYVVNTTNETFTELTQRWQDYLLEHADECINKTGVDRRLALRLLPYGEYVDDYKLKCFVRCIAADLDITNKNGTINDQDFLDILGISKVLNNTQDVTKCFHIMMKDSCETIFAVSECTYKTVQRELNSTESSDN